MTPKELAEYDDWMDYRYGDPDPDLDTKKAEGADDSDGPIPF